MSELWNVGVNQAADAVVVCRKNNHVLLIKRGDNGQWAFPGGFVNKDENTMAASMREAEEEAGVHLDNFIGTRIFSGKVDDHRNSDDRWVETDAYLFLVDSKQPVKGTDDAIEAKWFPVSQAVTIIQSTHWPIFTEMLKVIYTSMDTSV